MTRFFQGLDASRRLHCDFCNELLSTVTICHRLDEVEGNCNQGV